MTTRDIIDQFVNDLDLHTVGEWAAILHIERNRDTVKELRVAVADAMEKVGK